MSDEEECEVETIRIMMRDSQNSTDYFLVKWQGWSYSSCTWEPEAHLMVGQSLYLKNEIAFQRQLFRKKLAVSEKVLQNVAARHVWDYINREDRRLQRHLRDFYIAEAYRHEAGLPLFVNIQETWTHPK